MRWATSPSELSIQSWRDVGNIKPVGTFRPFFWGLGESPIDPTVLTDGIVLVWMQVI